LLDRIIAFAVGVLAIDDRGLLRMEIQPAFQESPLQNLAQPRSFMLATAVADDVVGIPLKRNTGKSPLQPYIEHIVQKQISQKGANDAALWRSPFPRYKTAIIQRRGRLQPTFDVEQHPPAMRVLAHRTKQELPVDVVEEALDIEIENPVEAPATLTCDSDRIDRRTTGTVPI
jgi:hypothetical protein